MASQSYPSEVWGAWGFGVASCVGFFVIACGTYFLVTYHKKKKLDGHGTARWAKRSEIVESGLLDSKTSNTSIIVGGYREKNKKVSYLVHTGPESCLLFAPARSGKGVSLVVPILLSYSKSCFVLDVKGELWEQTAGYRKSGLKNNVLYHDPSSMEEGNSRFNVMAEVRVGTPYAVKDAQLTVEYLIPKDKGDKGGNNEHFVKAAKTLFVGVILYELYKALETREEINTTKILSSLTDPELTARDYFSDMMAYENENCMCLKVIRETAAEQMGREDKEFGGVLSSLTTPLGIYRDPILANATSTSDFKIEDLVDHMNPVTLYLIIRPSDRDVLAHYFGLIVNLVCRRLTETLPNKDNPRHELLLMLDEFSSLPALPVVQQSMDVMPGYGVKAFIVLQDYESLKTLYTDSETISSNCKVTIAYTPAKQKTAELLSSMVGVSTVLEKTNTSQRKSGMAGMANDTVSLTDGVHSRALLTPDEIKRMPIAKVKQVDGVYRMTEPGEALLFSRGCRPIKSVQTPWFFDDEMTERAKHEAPEKSDVLHV